MTDQRGTPCTSDTAEAPSFAPMRDAFERAWGRDATWDARCVLCGQTARLRIAGAMLARHVRAPFAHLRAQECPAFWLDVGRDLEQIPQRIDEILGAA